MVNRSPGLGDEEGSVSTDGTMRHLDFANVYAAGDGAALSIPKLGHAAVMQADVAAAAIRHDVTGEGDIPPLKPEVLCIADRGGAHATPVYSDTLFRGSIDLTLDGPAAYFLKWGFDGYYFHGTGRLPPGLAIEGLEMLLRQSNH